MDQAFGATPGLHDAAWATYTPMSFNNWGTGIAFPGRSPNTQSTASYAAVSPRFFDAVGTRVLSGRSLTDSDTAASRHVAVVNKTFVNKFLEGKQPLGMRTEKHS
jgi:hypothetical protein